MSNESQQRLSEKISTWVERLEKKASELIEGADIEELTAKERFDVAAKLLTVKQRFLLLDMQSRAAVPVNRQEIILAAIMRQMRGEIGELPEISESTRILEQQADDTTISE